MAGVRALRGRGGTVGAVAGSACTRSLRTPLLPARLLKAHRFAQLARKKTAISTVETVAEELHRCACCAATRAGCVLVARPHPLLCTRARCKLWHARHASAHFRARRLREHLSRALACYRDRCVAEAEAEAEAKEERHADMLALHAELEADAMSLVDHMVCRPASPCAAGRLSSCGCRQVSKSSKVGAAPGAADVEAPDYFCGPISMELLRDPVVTPSGHTCVL